MSNQSTNAGGGGSFLSLLCLVFIVLKLTEVIAWSWWWVMAPLWIPSVLIVVFLAVYAAILFSPKKGNRPS